MRGQLASRCSDCAASADGSSAPNLPGIVQALARDDLDAALQAGLMDWCGQAQCPAAAGLTPPQLKRLQDAREERLRAFAARERHRARNQRLARRERERAERRAAAAAPRLPGAAALALARAKARAASGGGKP